MFKLIIYRDFHTLHWGYVSIDTHRQLSEFSKYFRQCKTTFLTLTFSNQEERSYFINEYWRIK